MDDSLPSPESPPRRLSDPRAMRALTHPVRLALIEVLTLHGALTATAAGELIGQTATTCSFHLRQLARYGFVEEAGGGSGGRSRPWRLLDLGWSIEDASGESSPAGAALVDLTLDRAVRRHRAARAAIRRQPEGPPLPPGATPAMTETIWWVTPDEFADLEKEIESLVFRFRDRLVDPARRPAGASAVEFVALTHALDVSDDRPVVS